MCGIAGYISYNQVPKSNIESCKKIMFNRGPDFIGEYSSNSFKINNHFIHSRLSIIDLSNKANQPFVFEDKVLLFNGEIYNYIELRKELVKKGHSFKTNSDSEVLLKSYIEYGDDCVKYFQGMWAFVIIDNKKKTFLISRDRFGEKPLYYYFNDKEFIFGSEIKYIKKISGKNFKINKKKIFHYLNLGYKSINKDNNSFFKEIHSLESGTNLELNENFEVKKKKYWSPKLKIDNKINYQDILENTEKLLVKSLEMRMRSDVPLAFCLSGGIDSGYLASIATKKLNKRLSTFSIIDSDPRYNEEKNINKIVRDLKCDSELIKINDEKSFFERLKILTKQHDSPLSTISYFIHSFLSESISKKGFKVSISGTGADEIFTGYYDHYLLYFASMYKENLDFDDELNQWRKNILPFIKNPELKKFDLYIKSPKYKDVCYGLTKKIKNLLGNKSIDKSTYNEIFYTEDPLKNRLLNEMFFETVPVILKHDDLNSMFYSIENRSPFLDHNLFELVYQIPSKFLINKSFQKKILRDISKDILIDDVRETKEKFGFNANLTSLVSKDEIGNYLNKNSEILEEFIEPKQLKEFLNDSSKFDGEMNKFIFSLISCKMFLELN